MYTNPNYDTYMHTYNTVHTYLTKKVLLFESFVLHTQYPLQIQKLVDFQLINLTHEIRKVHHELMCTTNSKYAVQYGVSEHEKKIDKSFVQCIVI